MRTLLLFGGILGILTIVGFFIFSSPKPTIESTILPTPTPQTQETVEAKAAFAIFTNGTFRIFSASMYHNLSEDAYIDSSNPNIVNVKKAGITWNDFFKTLPMKLSRDCLTTGTRQTFCTGTGGTLKFYLNGTKDQNALERTINNGDQLLVTFGSEPEVQIQKQLQQVPMVK